MSLNAIIITETGQKASLSGLVYKYTNPRFEHTIMK